MFCWCNVGALLVRDRWGVALDRAGVWRLWGWIWRCVALCGAGSRWIGWIVGLCDAVFYAGFVYKIGWDTRRMRGFMNA